MSIPTVPEHAPSQPLTPEPKKKFNWKLPLALFAAALVGSVVGAVASPTPDPVVEVQEKIVEKEVMVKQTPISCLTALDLNEEAFSAMSESLSHILDGDYTAANRATEAIKAKVPEVNAAKAKCRSNE